MENLKHWNITWSYSEWNDIGAASMDQQWSTDYTVLWESGRPYPSNVKFMIFLTMHWNMSSEIHDTKTVNYYEQCMPLIL
jgi:hypothetical protein